METRRTCENHACGFKWPIEAKRRGNAQVIVVDPPAWAKLHHRLWYHRVTGK